MQLMKPTDLDIAGLPVGAHPEALKFPHFPTHFQAVIWRNWEMVPLDVLARVLGSDEAAILALAADMGLRTPPQVSPCWRERGYVTIIRANWHLLPYSQLLELLGWSAARLADVLKEEDFLWHKLGALKPRVEPARCRPLNAAETECTRRICDTMRRLFPDIGAPDPARPFDFLKDFQSIPASHRPAAAAPAGLRNFDLRFLYSYSAVYGDALLDPGLNPYPDGLLARLSELGLNAVWLPLILYKMYPWKPFGAYSEGYVKRLNGLRQLTERAARFGLSVIIYLNEPRCMPLSFFSEHPELKGIEHGENAALCTALPEVKDLLRQGTAWLFREAPRLGGVFTITMSENLTNCFSKDAAAEPPYTRCPRCAGRTPAEAVADVNRLIAEGAHSVKPEAPVIAWDWAWSDQWAHAAVDLLPQDVWLMCTSEWGLPTCIGGVGGKVVDYSISNPGPSARSLALWQHARRRGLKTAAKIQLNNSWECSAVPYLPVPDLAEKHLDGVAEAGVSGVMAGWTLGGYPAGNLGLLRRRVGELAGRIGGREQGAIRAAWQAFSAAFREFPFSCGVLYVAPQNVGPKNLLYAKPTGYACTMVGDPYDCLQGWRSIYSEDVFESQWGKLSDGWRGGLKILQEAAPGIESGCRAAFDDLERVATAAYCHFRSAFLQVAFVRRRQSDNPADRAQVLQILDEEQQLAIQLHDIARRDSRIGFEATNHYAYTLQDLREKVLNCAYLRSRLTAAAATRSPG